MTSRSIKYAVATLLLSLALAAHSEERVYLLARLSIQGTTYNQAVFLYDKEANDIKTCEQDIVRGNFGQWQYYGHFVRKIKGIATTISYTCMATDLSISEWMSDNRYSHVYLVDRRKPALKVQPYENYAECVTAVRRVQKEESNEFYCAKSNQDVGRSADR